MDVISSADSLYTIKEPNGLTVLDLFCGCGGLSLGFKRAGFDIRAGIDNDRASLQTYQANVGKALNIDLSKEDWFEEFSESTGTPNIDVLIGGPPCQGFSLTGTRKFDDDRNRLYRSVFTGAKELDPSVILIENVRGMATLYGGKAKDEVIRLFEELGYNVSWKILDAAAYFVPQHRLRLFFVATKGSIKFDWPEPTNTDGTYVTCEQGIGDLPSMNGLFNVHTLPYPTKAASAYQLLMRQNSAAITNHEPTRHKDFVIDTIRQVPEGGNHKDLPTGVGQSRKFNEAWTRYHSKRPSRTIDTGHRNHFHYKYDRVPTIRENARLQSFPDDFVFKGSKTEQNTQVGNAVPVFLAQSLAASIQKALQK